MCFLRGHPSSTITEALFARETNSGKYIVTRRQEGRTKDCKDYGNDFDVASLCPSTGLAQLREREREREESSITLDFVLSTGRRSFGLRGSCSLKRFHGTSCREVVGGELV